MNYHRIQSKIENIQKLGYTRSNIVINFCWESYEKKKMVMTHVIKSIEKGRVPKIEYAFERKNMC